MKKVIVGLVAFLMVLPNFASAVSVAELQKQISALLAQVALLQQQMSQQAVSSGTSWCHNFNTDLQIGNSGSDVLALQTALEKEGLQIKGGWNTNIFDELTASAVSAFQQKYKNEILTPAGLSSPTGYVGGRTRTKLNSLYGCGATKPVSVTPVQTTSVNDLTQKSSVTPSITVLSPNGGEQWQAGATQVIKWNSSNLGGLKIAIGYDMNDQNYSIASGLPNTGSYSWTIPANFTPGNYVISVMTDDCCKPTARDTSNASFNIKSPISPVNPPNKPDITVPEVSCIPSNPKINEPIICAVTVHNNSAVNITKSFDVNIQGTAVTVSAPLNAWSKKTVKPAQGFSFSTAGNYVLNFPVDIWNSIDESDENNNTYKMSINVSGISEPTPTTGTISLSQNSFNFNYIKGEPIPSSQHLTFKNTSNTNITYTLKESYWSGWLSTTYSATPLVALPGTATGILASVDPSKLHTPGTYHTNIVITGNFTGSPLSIPVNLTVTDAPATNLNLAPYIRTYNPSLLNPGSIVTLYGGNFDSTTFVSIDRGFWTITPNYKNSAELSFTLPSNIPIGTHTMEVGNKGSAYSNSERISFSVSEKSVPAPTATLTGGTSGSAQGQIISAKVGETINYKWDSTNATSAFSSYHVYPAYTSASNCGGLVGSGPFTWVANSLNGSTSAIVESCQAGRDYFIKYTALNSNVKGGLSADSVLTIRIPSTTTSLNSSSDLNQMANILMSASAVLENMLKSLR